jgi:uncharacterized protein (TIGR04540 family)
MEVKLFYRTQRELAKALNHLVDSYWEDKINETDLIDGIINMYENNHEKLVKNKEFTIVVKQQCGKRRLAVVGKILGVE